MSNKEVGEKFEYEILSKLVDNGIECNSVRTSYKISNRFIPTGDGGIDLFGNYKSLDYVIQCKFKSDKYSIGPNYVNEFKSKLSDCPRTTYGFMVTNSRYTQRAQNIASNSKLNLILCTDKNIVEQIFLAREQLENEKLKNNFTSFEELTIDLDNDNSNVDFYGIKLSGKCKITSRNLVTRFNPY